MRVLLVGNYEPDEQQSMQRYARWLLGALRTRGVTVVLIRPVAMFSKLAFGPFRSSGIVKYLGYLDKYLIFPGQLKQAARQFDLVHVCDHSNSMYLKATAGVPAVITCHDLLAVRSALGEFKETSTGWTGRRLQAWILRGLKRAANVICVSAKTAEDFQRLAGALEDRRVEVIPNPLNWHYQPRMEMPGGLLERLGLAAGENYFLHVGGNQWYKNRPAVMRIFAELVKMDEFAAAKLVMAGKPFPAGLKQLVEKSGLRNQVIEITGTSNEELEALYSHAVALIFPSLEEGFGWPIVEAQACGCVVAVSSRPPMTEVAGNAAILINPDEPSAAAELIRVGLRRPSELRSAGLKNVERFAPETIAEKYLEFYATM